MELISASSHPSLFGLAVSFSMKRAVVEDRVLNHIQMDTM